MGLHWLREKEKVMTKEKNIKRIGELIGLNDKNSQFTLKNQILKNTGVKNVQLLREMLEDRREQLYLDVRLHMHTRDQYSRGP